MINTCIKYLEKTAKEYPEKTAIFDSNKSANFNELRNKSLQIAGSIPKELRNQPIAIFLPKSIEAIEAFLGVLYSGNFYVPIDVKSPGERTKKLLKNLLPPIILTNSGYLKILDKINHQSTVINIDVISGNKPTNGYLTNMHHTIDVDPIYCIYTSGSTGNPKGVVLSHRSVNDFIEWSEKTYKVDNNTIIGNQAPLVFDVSVMDIYLCLKTGATLFLIPEFLFSFPIKLLEYIKENKINHIIWVPSVLINVANSGLLDDFQLPDLKNVLFAGEVMPNKHLNLWRKCLPNALFSNLYGPTEAAVIATYYIVDRKFNDDDPLPIGKPCKNMDTMIINDQGKPVDKGEVGELLVRGTALAMGYWNNVEKTESCFVQNPLNKEFTDIVYKTGDLVKYNENNEIIFLGRKDSQIKHLGYRIELGEIEAATYNLDEIENSCVLYDQENKNIVLFYESNANIDEAYIRRNLLSYVPKYMLPTRIIKLKEFPTNVNGKIDRILLKNDYLS